jgi:acyl dehydratase
VTEDHQFIHVDPEKAKATAFGTTIAHGFLTMSMMSVMSSSCRVERIILHAGRREIRRCAN